MLLVQNFVNYPDFSNFVPQFHHNFNAVFRSQDSHHRYDLLTVHCIARLSSQILGISSEFSVPVLLQFRRYIPFPNLKPSLRFTAQYIARLSNEIRRMLSNFIFQFYLNFNAIFRSQPSHSRYDLLTAHRSIADRNPSHLVSIFSPNSTIISMLYFVHKLHIIATVY